LLADLWGAIQLSMGAASTYGALVGRCKVTTMPSTWTKKDERQYEHIKRSNVHRGVATDWAEEIAARTVNKNRRRKGQTPRKTSQGEGNPNTPLDDRTKDELYNIARKLRIRDRSSMDKGRLIAAIRKRQ
jgi:hypothetical protein